MRRLKKLLHKGSHFTAKWDEPENLQSVIPQMDVVVYQTIKDVVSESLYGVGDMC